MNTSEKPTILAVDDDPIILNTVLSTLRLDYNVVPFPNANAALKYLESKHTDLILLDYNMPGMSGFDMLDYILANERLKEIPVIFLTGAVDGEGESAALQMGAVDYITKPIRPRALLTRISVQLELYNHRKNLEKLVEAKTRWLNEAYNLLRLREEVTLNLLARVTEMRDSETGCHIERTTEYVKVIVKDILRNPAEGYELTADDAEDIIKSAKLHDLGKIAIPDSILLKPGKLTSEEFEIIKSHTTHGERLLADTMESLHSSSDSCGGAVQYDGEEEHPIYNDNFLKTAREIAYGHHEKWNGSGYPQCLKESEIPLSARIVAIADVYDALTSERPYKRAFSHEESTQIIVSDSGKHFDPRLVEIFQKHGNRFERIAHTI